MQSHGSTVVLVLGPTGSGKSLLVQKATDDQTVEVGDGEGLEPVTRSVKSSKVTTRQSLVFIDTPAPTNARLDAELLKAISDEMGRQLNGNGRIGCVVYCLKQTGSLCNQDVINGLWDLPRLSVKHPELQDAALIFAALGRNEEKLTTIPLDSIVKKCGIRVKLASGTPCRDIDSLKNLVLKQCDDSKPVTSPTSNKYCFGWSLPWHKARGRSDM